MSLQLSQQVSRAAAAGELIRRRGARKHLLDFTRYTMPEFQVSWHHKIVADYLTRFAYGDIKRLMLFMPPRHTKSEFVSRRLPAFIYGINPDARIIAASYSADLAQRMNRDVQRVIDSPEYGRLFPNTGLFGKNIRTIADGSYLRNSDIFEIVGGSGIYRGAGIGGGITGMGFDFGIIDDPIKSRAEANSLTYREHAWEWLRGVFYTRQQKGAGILLTVTRWHEDDMPGRLMALADSDPNADQWVILRFPAIADDDLHPDDPRRPGEPLWPGMYDLEQLTAIHATIGEFEWNAQYQQRPKAPEGNRFKRAWFPIVDVVPSECKRIRYWDKAGSEGEGAYTAGVLLARHDASGKVYVEHVVRGQWSAYERESVIRQTAESDKARYGLITNWVEQEPGSGGKESAEATIRNLAGFIVKADRPVGDKDTRLEPFAVQAEAGNVALVRGIWNMGYIEEIVSIPSGKYRDQSDATAGAFNKLFSEPEPLRPGSIPGLGAYRG